MTGNTPSKFDRVQIQTEKGTWLDLAPDDYRKMPLVDRIKLIMEKKVRFYLAGQQV